MCRIHKKYKRTIVLSIKHYVRQQEELIKDLNNLGSEQLEQIYSANQKIVIQWLIKVTGGILVQIIRLEPKKDFTCFKSNSNQNEIDYFEQLEMVELASTLLIETTKQLYIRSSGIRAELFKFYKMYYKNIGNFKKSISKYELIRLDRNYERMTVNNSEFEMILVIEVICRQLIDQICISEGSKYISCYNNNTALNQQQMENLIIFCSLLKFYVVKQYLYCGREKEQFRVVERDLYSGNYENESSKNYINMSKTMFSNIELNHYFQQEKETVKQEIQKYIACFAKALLINVAAGN